MKNVITFFLFSFFLTYVLSQGEPVVLDGVTSSGTWTVPAGVTKINVECWGGGGGGAYTNSNIGGGGGGGGAYASSTFCVSQGETFNYAVGAGGSGASGTNNGGDTWFKRGTTVLVNAEGGKGAVNNSNTGGLGGQSSASIGDTKYSGGNGGSGSWSSGSFCGHESGGGGGGGAARSNSNGNAAGNGSSSTGGFLCSGNGSWAGAGGSSTSPGGNGGNGGVKNGNGNNGANYGGGGGGSANADSGIRNGGNGGNGVVVITFIRDTPVFTSGQTSICANSTGNVYSINAIPNAISYHWSVPNGWTITSGAGTTSITVTSGTNSGDISVYATVSACPGFTGTGTSTTAISTVSIKPSPTVNAGPDITICGASSQQLNGAVTPSSYTTPGFNYSTSFTGCSTTGSSTVNCSGWSLNGGYGSWGITSSAVYGATSCNDASAKANIYGTSPTSQLISTSSLGTSNGQPVTLSFLAKCTNYNAGTTATTANYCLFEVYWGTSNTGPWTKFDEKNNLSSSSCKVYTFATFTPPAGQNVFIRIVSKRIDGDFVFVIDDISVIQADLISPVSITWTGGTIVSGNTTLTPTVNHPSTSTYRLTATNPLNGCSISDDVLVSIGSTSTAPTSITGGGNSCHGSSVTLTQVGGSLAGSANYEWFSGSCGGTSIGTGNSITVYPSSTTTYFVRAGADGGCPPTNCASGTVSLPPQSTGLANNNESATCNVKAGETVKFYHSSGRYIATVKANSVDLGPVNATVYVDNPDPVAGQPISVVACDNSNFNTAVLGRHWVITPSVNVSAQVTLPYYNQEISSLYTASSTSSNPYDDIIGQGLLGLSKYSGPVNVNNLWSDNCPPNGNGSTTWQLPNSYGELSDIPTMSWPANGDKYSTFLISGFSEFWLHGSSVISPLSVELSSFTAFCNDNESAVNVKWSTSSEQNSSHFIVERSLDGEQWDEIATLQASGNSTNTLNYNFVDDESIVRIKERIYYRLNQFDFNGDHKQYGPISVTCSNEQLSMELFPNPSSTNVNIVLYGQNEESTFITFSDLQGKLMKTIDCNQNSKIYSVDIADLTPGVYLVRLMDGISNKQIIRFIKQ